MEHNFILRYQLDPADAASDVDDVLERLGEAGCTDAVVGIGLPGKITLDFARSATSLQQAIRIAVADVESAIPTAVLYSKEVTENGEEVDEVLIARLAIMECDFALNPDPLFASILDPLHIGLSQRLLAC
ncbi:hypothetical protein [Herbaspirillum aquaticum]|uniref:DNA-binding protein n=1 Tax=Herbaspirillum aquaticum TaxID=568783 RepID=A0A225SQ81_9BURK|nr:hypothetical protein [Herbaspirillum aquaticum]OWY32935.1 hypothetical protein CEJ45_18590 [Herbaspirillum aquaticum]